MSARSEFLSFETKVLCRNWQDGDRYFLLNTNVVIVDIYWYFINGDFGNYVRMQQTRLIQALQSGSRGYMRHRLQLYRKVRVRKAPLPLAGSLYQFRDWSVNGYLT